MIFGLRAFLNKPLPGGGPSSRASIHHGAMINPSFVASSTG